MLEFPNLFTKALAEKQSEEPVKAHKHTRLSFFTFLMKVVKEVKLYLLRNLTSLEPLFREEVPGLLKIES